MNNSSDMEEQSDSMADAFAAVILVAVFVTACLLWVSSQ